MTSSISTLYRRLQLHLSILNQSQSHILQTTGYSSGHTRLCSSYGSRVALGTAQRSNLLATPRMVVHKKDIHTSPYMIYSGIDGLDDDDSSLYMDDITEGFNDDITGDIKSDDEHDVPDIDGDMFRNKKQEKPDMCILPKHAEKIVELIDKKVDIKNDSCLYINNSAGDGSMSKALLKAGAKRLAILYYAKQHREKLEAVRDKHVKKHRGTEIYIHKANLMTRVQKGVLDGESRAFYENEDYVDTYEWDVDYDGKDLTHLYEPRPGTSSGMGTRIFTTCVGNSWWAGLSSLLLEGYFDHKLCHRAGGLDVYCLMSKNIFEKFQANNRKVAFVKLRALYDVEIMAHFPGSIFKYKLTDVSLVRFTSKASLIDRQEAEDTRQTMLASFFILQECSRRNVMIPRMHELLADSGLELAALGHRFDVGVRDLSPSELFDFVKAIQTMRNYSQSVFSHLEHHQRGEVYPYSLDGLISLNNTWQWHGKG